MIEDREGQFAVYGKWKTMSASALVKPGVHLENKKFHFKCIKFSKNVLSVMQ